MITKRIQVQAVAMLSLLLWVLLLSPQYSNAGSLQLSWDQGPADSVYTARLTKLNLNTHSPGTSKDYTVTGTCNLIISDVCSVFYPGPSETDSFALIIKLGAYDKINTKWVWRGWSWAVLDMKGDLGAICTGVNTGVQLYNLPYPLHPGE